MAARVATPASLVTLAAEITATATQSGYAINATQFAAMLALPHFSPGRLYRHGRRHRHRRVAAALASSLSGLSSSVLSHITMTLGTPATVTVATAEALHALPGFSAGGSAA